MDPIELRNEIATDYHRNAKRMGSDVSMEDARALAADDLAIVDALDREAKPQAMPSKSAIITEPEPAAEMATAEQMAAEVGGKFKKRSFDDSGPKETLTATNPEKRIKLTARVALLCSKEGRTPMYPAFAKAVAYAHANWNLVRMEYRRCRTQKERDRMFFRELEDICDKSNSILPAWWVK